MKLNLRNFIQAIHNFPKEGIVFRDVSPLLKHPAAFASAINQMSEEWEGRIDAIAALDARGFIFGGPLAIKMGLPIVMLRKKGKLPGDTISVSYDLEYGSATLEVQRGSFEKGSRVLIIDDLLATGGTARAACELVNVSGAQVSGCAFVVELGGLEGRKLLGGHPIQALVSYEE